MTSGITSFLWFLAIIAMIPIALWLLKRTPMGGGAAQGLMRSIAVLPVSPSQKLITVEVGSGDERRWLVLGVTAQSITTLHTMAPQDGALSTPATPMPPMPFAQLLGKLRPPKGDDGAR